MNKNYELEKRVLTIVSRQFEGIYQINLDDKAVTCVYDIKDEAGEGKVVPLDSWLDMLNKFCYCEDKENLGRLLAVDSLFQCIKAQKESDKPYNLRRDYRFMKHDRVKWICVTLMPETVYNEITVTFRDVSHRYEYDEIIQKKNSELRKLLQTAEQYRDALLSESVVLYQVNFTRDSLDSDLFQKNKDGNGVIKVLNTVDMYKSSSYNEYCARWQSRVSKDTIDEYRRYATSDSLVEEYRAGRTLLNQDYRTLDSFGVEMWINKTIYLAQDKVTGDVIGIVSLRDVTDRYRQEFMRETLEKQASTDLLTGLYNHVTGEVLIKSKIDNEKHMDAAFIIFDIDFFKKINDTRGHYFGDCVLQKVAEILKGCIRENQDVAARYGGDEFVIFVTYKQEDDIYDIVDRIFKAISTQYDGYQISISMGICLASACEESYYDMYKKADRALYKAKEDGKGRYIFSN